LPARSLLVYVTQTPERFHLEPGDHLLIFRIPVQIPGASLPAGPYIFKLVAPSLLRVISATDGTIYATFFTISDSGEGDISRERLRFEQYPEDDVPRIVGWYLPGGEGFEFLYPKRKHKPAERVPDR
jgi:hypothetical protein